MSDIQLLSRTTVIIRLGISMSTLDRLLAANKGPPVIRIGRRIMFREDQLNQWIEAIQSQSDQFTLTTGINHDKNRR